MACGDSVLPTVTGCSGGAIRQHKRPAGRETARGQLPLYRHEDARPGWGEARESALFFACMHECAVHLVTEV